MQTRMSKRTLTENTHRHIDTQTHTEILMPYSLQIPCCSHILFIIILITNVLCVTSTKGSVVQVLIHNNLQSSQLFSSDFKKLIKKLNLKDIQPANHQIHTQKVWLQSPSI